MQLIFTQFRSTTKKIILNIGSRLNFANISVSNAKKIAFEINLYFIIFTCSIGRRHFRLEQNHLTEN